MFKWRRTDGRKGLGVRIMNGTPERGSQGVLSLYRGGDLKGRALGELSARRVFSKTRAQYTLVLDQDTSTTIFGNAGFS